MLVDVLRSKIITLAVQGKLVPQNTDEGDSEVLLEKIRNAKCSRGKNYTPSVVYMAEGCFYERTGDVVKNINDRLPFTIPSSWGWAKINDITYNVSVRKSQVKSNNVSLLGNIPVVSQGAAPIDGYTNEDASPITDLPVILFGDHTRNIKYVDFPFIVGGDGVKLFKAEGMCPKYLYYALKNIAELLPSRGYARHYDLMVEKYIPIPPLAEQKRIVEKIESLFTQIEYIELKQNRLTKNITALEEKLFNLAIQGQLVPQNPNDEPASVLMEKIIAQGGSSTGISKKKNKQLSSIFKGEDGKYYEKRGSVVKDIDKEIPFDIPKGWEWARINSLCLILNGDRGKNYPSKNKLSSTGIPFISALNIDGESVISDNKLLCLSEEQYKKLSNGKLQKDDIVVCIRGSIGKHGVYPYDRGAIASSLVILRPYIISFPICCTN